MRRLIFIPVSLRVAKKGSERSAIFLLAANVLQRMDLSQDKKQTNKKIALFLRLFFHSHAFALPFRSQGLIRNCMLCCLPLINIGDTSRARLRESVGRNVRVLRARTWLFSPVSADMHVARLLEREGW